MIARVKADAARGRDFAALDVDGGLIKGVAAGADAGTGSLAGPVLFAAALSRDSAALDVDDGAAVAAVAAADARSGGAALGSNFCCTLDEDVGVALGSIAAADGRTRIIRSLDFAAVDVDLRGVGRLAAAADGCTGAAGGCDVAVSDTDNGLEGVRITCRTTEDDSFTAAADG